MTAAFDALMPELTRHAMAWYPREACALIVREPDGALGVVLADNEADRWHALDPETFPRTAERGYVMDARLFVACERADRSVLAIMHSHCDVGAYFSDEDLRAAIDPSDGRPLFPSVLYVVLDVARDGLRGYRVFAWSEAHEGFVASDFAAVSVQRPALPALPALSPP